MIREDYHDLSRLYQPEPQDAFDDYDREAFEADMDELFMDEDFDPGEYDPSEEGDGRQGDWQAEADFAFEPWE